MRPSAGLPAAAPMRRAGKASTRTEALHDGQTEKRGLLRANAGRGVRQRLQFTLLTAAASAVMAVEALLPDYSGIADPVVKRALFLVKSSHDVTDQQDHAAHPLGEVPPAGPEIG